MSHAQTLRRITAEERLRQTHIETLELLQAKAEENDKLRKELQALGLKSANTAPHLDLDSNLFSVSHSDICTHEVTIEKQKEELNVLNSQFIAVTAEVKTLKIHLTNRTKQYDTSVQDLQKSNIMLNDELALHKIWVEMLLEDQSSQESNKLWICAYTPSIEIISTSQAATPSVIHALEASLTECRENSAALLSKYEAKTAECEALVLDKIELIRMLKESQSLLGSIPMLQSDVERLRQQCVACEQREGTLKSEVRRLEGEVELLRTKTDEAASAHTTDTNVSSTTASAIASSSDVPNNSNVLKSISTESLLMDPEHNFSEFVRLKKENKTLKLQIALLRGDTTSARVGVGGSTSRRTSSSTSAAPGAETAAYGDASTMAGARTRMERRR